MKMTKPMKITVLYKKHVALQNRQSRAGRPIIFFITNTQ